jgi:hypothetical protein
MDKKIIASSGLILGGCALFAMQPMATAKNKAPRESKAPAAKIVGEPVNCVTLSNIRSSKVHDDYTIDFKMNGGKTYRNTLPNRCSGLGFQEAFSYKTSLSQLCNVDIITVLYSTGGQLDRGASCGLGKFQPIELVQDDKSEVASD